MNEEKNVMKRTGWSRRNTLEKKKKKRFDGTWRASVLSSFSPHPSITHRFEATRVARFGNPESIIIDSKRMANSQSGRKRGGEKGGGLPGANRRNAVSIIQLKTDMYRHQVGIVAKPAIVNCWALERRSFRQEDRGTRLLTGRNALCPPFVRRARLASLRVRFYREVFESRKK